MPPSRLYTIVPSVRSPSVTAKLCALAALPAQINTTARIRVAKRSETNINKSLFFRILNPIKLVGNPTFINQQSFAAQMQR